ncbi:MAG: hypothetical protein RID91_01510 [Azospirillaceae bacterium]
MNDGAVPPVADREAVAAERADRAFARFLAAEASTAAGAAMKLRAALAIDGAGVDRALDRRSRDVPTRILVSLLRDLEAMALEEAGRLDSGGRFGQ